MIVILKDINLHIYSVLEYLILFIFLILITHAAAYAQYFSVKGQVRNKETQEPIFHAKVFLESEKLTTETDQKGTYQIRKIKKGNYLLVAFALGYERLTLPLKITNKGEVLNFFLSPLTDSLENILIKEDEISEVGYLRSIENMGIYEAKKSELILLDQVVANKAANNARQVFAQVPGFNIWESDCAGLQIGVGGRGLSPNRSSHFNMRQDGYDISADALGYPESYYSPPLQALEKIEIVRGAGSLQYGTQFGGLINFVVKKGAQDKPISLEAEETYNTLGFYNGFHSIGGTVGKVNYYLYNRFAKGDCWRRNSDFTSTTSGLKVVASLNQKLQITLDYTHSYYVSKQPGGLTDSQFQQNAQQSNRERNWFRIGWNLPALTLDYRISQKTRLNSRFFALIGGRESLGDLGRIDRLDFGENRDYLSDNYRNIGNETRLIHYYTFLNQTAALLGGVRFYRGFTKRRQGDGDDSDQPNFSFLNPNKLEDSEFDFHGTNAAVFAENIFNLSEKWSITPGLRFEFIRTEADGYYRTINKDLAGNIILDKITDERKKSDRNLWLMGVGLSYKPKETLEIYANFSQNYRSVTFNDIRVNNPNLVVDENIKDERGYNIDLSMRGQLGKRLKFDISLFHLAYKDRIGAILKKVSDAVIVEKIIRFRTNISDAQFFGVEAFSAIQLLNQMSRKNLQLSLFTNMAFLNAQYINSNSNGVEGNSVELVPAVNFKTGVTLVKSKFRGTCQYSYVSSQFSDASNARFSATAVEGEIPAYQVIDIALSYEYKRLQLRLGCNNLLNEFYFTRRASGYPGPGIIPSDGRSFYLGLGYKW